MCVCVCVFFFLGGGVLLGVTLFFWVIPSALGKIDA